MLIGISGYKNVGKDTFCDYLVNNHNFIKIAFADKIKRILIELYDINPEYLFGPSNNREIYDLRYKMPNSNEYLNSRIGLQAFGDCGRSLYLETWVDYTLKIAKKLQNSYFYDYKNDIGIFKNYLNPGKKNVIISDCRYLNEMNKVREMGGKIIRIKKNISNLNDKFSNHSSEANQVKILDSYFDHIIDNTSTLEDLYKKIDEYMVKNT